ncbi:hypothetical protein Syun_005789 [Stephania yunnanensis]|uniref:Leucine-rich repeat-containing N-terminal plant-type domain-containing protein n=1 Tax=Stephania yunnanensis TaxID=152371 RepID=A0AAP0KVF0_9MAGN
MTPSYAMFLAFASLLILAYCNDCYVSAATCHPDDESGLLAFKSGITEDPLGLLSNWKPGTDCCFWSGIDCIDNRRRVRFISLYGQPDNPKGYLSGTISPLLSKVRNLRSIQFIDLRNMTGSFPRFVYNLPNLIFFSIENSKLSGPLPADFGPLSNLYSLNLKGNRFSGSIPDGLRKLKELTALHLGENRFSGEIPNFWDSFPKLVYLQLQHNKLSGGIPTSIASLAPNFQNLELNNNQLSGKIPEFISNFKGLHTLDLSSNMFTGVLPKNFKNLTGLRNLKLARNKLVDPFPALAIDRIVSLDLSYNKFKLGKIPEWVVSSDAVESLKLAGCGIKMRLDDLKPSWTYYIKFNIDLSDNEISGSAVNLANGIEDLEGFWMSGNRLKFNLSDFKMRESLKYLDLSRNQVFGSVPESIVGLEKLNLSYNRLCGKIPASKFPASAFKGNACLCGSPLPACRRL